MFRRLTILWSLLFLLSIALLSPALAQSPQLTGSLQEIRIEGATDNEDLIRTFLVSRPGISVTQIDLEEERNLVYSLGYYSAVSVNLEDRGGGPVLIIRVEENPPIAEVVVEGVEAADPTRLVQVIADAHLLEPGEIFNTTAATDAIATLQEGYRQSGFPFDVPVTLSVAPETDAPEDEAQTAEDLIDLPGLDDDETGGVEEEEEPEEESEEDAEDEEDAISIATDEAGTPVILTYTVDESVPLREVTFEGNSVLDEEALSGIFRPLERGGTFTIQAYVAAVEEVNEQYRELGFRDSGVFPAETRLEDGVLQVGIRELRVGGYDTTAIGVDPGELTLQPGDLYNYDTILEDVQRLAQGRTTDIAIETLPLSSGDVRVSFRTGPPDTAGPIDAVQIEGNTVIPTETLLETLRLSEGDTFTSALAEEDFASLVQAYADEGYVVATQPDFNYLDGTYVQRIIELKIAGYRVTFEDEDHSSKDFIITRYLPDVGEVLNQDEFVRSLQNVARQGAVQPLGFNAEPSEEPDEVIVNVSVRELPSGTFGPQATYDTLKGFTAAVNYGNTNFLGRQHTFNAEVTAQTSDIGFLVGGSVSYSIPWLYIDALDFKQVPTSASLSLFSNVESNNALTRDGQVRVCFDPQNPEERPETCDDDQEAFVGEYTRRDTGIGFSVGRRIFPDTTARLSANGRYSAYFLEPEIKCDREGDANTPSDCTLPEDQALEELPQSGLSATITTSVNFDNRTNPDFPRDGLAATGSVGIGFGSDFRNEDGERQGYTYYPVEFGVSTYLPLDALFPRAFDPNHVFAFKLSAGYQFGGEYPSGRKFSVGQTVNNNTLIRGYNREDFNPSRAYTIGTVEYRYDFGLDTVATQTIIAIAFLDVGYASNVPGFESGGPLFAGAGVGVQINLGFTALGFFPLRFDYGFSERHPSGVFSFRVGPVF